MTEAPKTIWTMPYSPDVKIEREGGYESDRTKYDPEQKPTEYIRKDIHDYEVERWTRRIKVLEQRLDDVKAAANGESFSKIIQNAISRDEVEIESEIQDCFEPNNGHYQRTLETKTVVLIGVPPEEAEIIIKHCQKKT